MLGWLKEAPRAPRLHFVSKTGGDSRGLRGATDSAENRALATEVARHRAFLKTLDAGSIPATSTKRVSERAYAPMESVPHYRGWRGRVGRG